jgi:hypothetical protein
MRKLILLVGLVVLLVGCTQEGYLAVHNKTGARAEVVIDGTRFTLIGETTVEEVYYVDSYLLFSESVKVDIEHLGPMHLEPRKYSVSISPNKTKHVNIYYDRSGLFMLNNSTTHIMEVYLRDKETGELSENYLPKPIIHSETELFPVITGSYFVVVIDGYGHDYESEEEIEFVAGENHTIIFNGFDVYAP